MEELNGSNNNNLNRMKALTGAYYGVDNDDTNGGEDTTEARANAGNLDSSWFNVNLRVSELLKTTPYMQLLDVDEELRKHIVQLDNSMQLLVYENYSKFIGATDTMQNMKEKLIKMESQVSGLESKMDAIANATRRMNERNSSKREEVARLDRLGGLVNKLSTLFELPKKLRSVTDVVETLELVQLYKSALPYLSKHANVPSFAKIDRDAKDATIEIQVKLKNRLAGGVNIEGMTPQEFDAMINILLDLDEPSEPLAPLFFRWHHDFIFQGAVSKEDAVKETFETCVFLLKTTMFEPLSQTLTTGEELFPEDVCSEEVAELKSNLAKDVVLSVLDKLRARFDAEPANFLQSPQEEEEEGESEDEAHEDTVDRIIRALALTMKEFSAWDRALPSHTLQRGLRLGDRSQELAERVVRKQVNGIMSELKQRTDDHLHKLEAIDQGAGGFNQQLLDEVSKSIISDANEARNHFTRLLKKATVVVSTSDMSSSFDELFKFQMREWSQYLGDSLKGVSKKSGTMVLLAKALLAKLLSTRTKELGVFDQKAATKSLSTAGDDALKLFCTLHGVEAAKNMAFSYSDVVLDRRPSKVGDGVVFMLNHIVMLLRMVKNAGVQFRRTASLPTTGTGATGGAPQASSYTRPTAQTAGQRQPGGVVAPAAGLGSQILKLFSEKLIVFDRVEFDGTAISAAALRVALKTWFEHVREEVLNRYAFQQIQLDANFVRNFVPMLTGDHAAQVTKLVAEVVASARERCVDPSTMDPVALDTMCNERKDDVKLR